MDLFVINRYKDKDEEVDLVNQETEHLQKLKQKIEERKKAYTKSKKKDIITLKAQESVQNSSKDDIVSAFKGAEDTEAIVVYNQYLKNREINQNVTKIAEKHVNDKPQHEFKVLGISNFVKQDKVKRILPYWLSHPFIVSTNLKNTSCRTEDQDWLHDTLKSTLLSEGVTHLFPVQEKVVPFVLNEHKSLQSFWPRDICVSAPTGSGKTLSFVLPIIQILMKEISHYIRALVVLPVQELATQVAKVFKKYCTKTGLKVALLSGSVPLRQEQQQIVRYTESQGWKSEVDIVVCTAGRLVEHIQNTEGFSLKHLKFLVIDEADRIMDHIQNDWLYHLDKHIKLENELMTGRVTNLNWNSLNELRAPPHKLLFSATLSQDPEKLEQWGLFQPKLFSAAQVSDFEDEDYIRKFTTPDELIEQSITCNAEEKPLILYHFLIEKKWNKVLCFTNAAQSAHRLTTLLNTWGDGNLKVAELSSSLNRTTREAVLKKFTLSEINMLIGTDALARGIDIPDCDYVISYDPPKNIKTYIHRVGRTGRAGRTGHAVTILLQNQVNLFKELLISGGKSEIPQIEIQQDTFKQLSEDYEQAIYNTKILIHEEINSKVKKSIALKRGLKSKPQKRKYDQMKTD